MKNELVKRVAQGVALGAAVVLSQSAMAACSDINRTALQNAADAVIDGGGNGGLGFPSWATVVDTTGKVCHVVTSGVTGANVGNDKWLGSRMLSAQKANAANAFSTDSFALSTANLYGTVQPGGSLFGLQHSNPVDAGRAYLGSPNTWGTNGDALKNNRIGGVNVFGGGLALYNGAGVKVGAIGVSGDTSCTDHINAWKIRAILGLDNVPGGVAGNNNDAMIIGDFRQGDGVNDVVSFGVAQFQHPDCGSNGDGVDDADVFADGMQDAIDNND
jgi:uncharacterized protein GlcG (DUF336 family)